MAFTIKENQGQFLIEGIINSSTANYFQDHCMMLLNEFGELTINIENTTEIDKSGLLALRAIYNQAITYNRKFYIVGIGCKEIYDDFRFSNAA